MKLGMISRADRDGFAYVKSKGLTSIEFCVNDGRNPLDFLNRKAELKEYVDEFGIEVSSIGRWGAKRLLPDGTLSSEEMHNSHVLIDLARELGCPNFVCGVNYIPELPYDQNIALAIEYFQNVISYAREQCVKVSVYNCSWNNFVVQEKEWQLVLGAIEELGIKYDTSHCIERGGDYLSEMKRWAHRFNHVHIKGSLVIDGEVFDNPPAGLDQVNWGAFMQMLYISNYKGYLSIEPHSANWHDELGERGVDFSIRYIKQFLI